MLRQLAAVELQVDVPAERGDARRRRRERRPGQHAARQHHEADAARAQALQSLQLGLARVLGDDDDGPRLRTERRRRLEGAAVVEAVAGRLDDDGARRAHRPARGEIVGGRRVRRREGRRRRERPALLVDMHVAVACARVGGQRRGAHEAFPFPSRDARQRVACGAFTAPSGTSPRRSAPSWATVSSAWCSIAGSVRPPMCGVASTRG